MNPRLLAPVISKEKNQDARANLFRVALPDGPCNENEWTEALLAQGMRMIAIGTMGDLDKIERSFRDVERGDRRARAAVQGEVQAVSLLDLSIIAGAVVMHPIARRWGDL